MSKSTDYRKIFAWTGIYLIISLTFFTANALAAMNYRVSGEDLVNGWRKSDDVTIFYANASANVSLQLANGQWQPMICTMHGNNSYTCEWFLNKNTVTLGNISRQLRLESQLPLEYTTTLKIDKVAPRITALNITKLSGALKVTYSIKDLSYPGRTDCSGLDYVLYVVGSESDTIEFNTTTCTYDDTVIFNESGFYQEDFPITITAYDRLGLFVTNTTIITVDLMGPEIQDDWQIIRGRQVIETLSKTPENMRYDVVVFIDDPKLDVTKVRGDLSGLHTNTVQKNLLKNKQATCLKESENLYKCTFFSIPIKPASANLQISVNAYDTSGNYANETLPKTVTLLDNPGQITYVGPLKEHCTSDLSKCYSGTGSQMFIADISLGSNFSMMIFGFSTETVPKVGPCFHQEDKWQCFYRYTVPNVAQLKVYIPETSTDIYGNQVTYTERNVVVDSVDPIILGNITPSLPDCAVSGDTLELTVRAKEALSDVLKVHVDTKGFTNVDQTNGTCEKTTNDEWACTLEVTGFVSEYQSFTRKVVVEDLAGNKVETDFKFEVCAQDANAVPNIITRIDQENKIHIDRRTASWLPIKTYVPLKITKTRGTIIEMTVDNCQADDENGLSVLDSGHYFIDNTLVLYIGFEGAILPEEEFDINCTVNARVRVGNKVYLKPEMESFILKAKPYNNPLGVLDNAVSKKIEQEKAALRDLDASIKWRGDLNNVVMLFCNLAKLVAIINGVLQTLKSALYVACITMASTGILPVVAAAEAAWAWSGGALNWFDENVAQHAWPTSILNGAWYGHVLKYTCMLYTCQHYKVSGLYTFTSDAVEGITALGRDQATTIFVEDWRDHEIYYVDSETIMIDGVEFKKTSDEGGTETWKSKSGEVIQYHTSGTNAWTIEEPGKLFEKDVLYQNLYGTYGSGELSPDGKTYTLDSGRVLREVKNPDGSIAWQMEGQISFSLTKPSGTTHWDGRVTTPDGRLWAVSDNGNWVVVSSTTDPLVYGYVQPGTTTTTTIIASVENENKIIDQTLKKKEGAPDGYYIGPRFIAQEDIQSVFDFFPTNHDNKDTLRTNNMIEKYGRFDVYAGNILSYGQNNWATIVSRPTSNQVTALYNDYPKLANLVYGNNIPQSKRTSRNLPLSVQNIAQTTPVVFVPGGGFAIYDITGKSILDSVTGMTTEPDVVITPPPSSGGLDWNDANQEYFNRNTKFYSALENEDWIVNPYRSTHWDGLCFPAVLYNLQKEKQLRCKYVSCLETQTSAGMPSYVCDKEFGMETCLYLDSAQWHVTGGHFWDTIGPGLLKSGFSFIAGMAPYLIYDITCADYKLRNFKIVSITELFVFGSKDVACGFFSSGLQFNEILALGTGDFWSNLYGSEVPKDPAEIENFCEGVDYSE